MCCKQGETAAALNQMIRNGPCQCQTVESGCATTDFIHQDKRVFCRAVQDGGRFGHLDHESRSAASQIVSCADAGENTVNRSDDNLIGRNEAAYISQQDDQRRLSHVSRFAAHIGAGNQKEFLVIRQLAVVCDKTFYPVFNDRMTSLYNMND